MAVSGIKAWTTPKMMNRTAKVTNRPIILGDDHGNSTDPPHWRARMRETIDEVRKKKPTGSNWRIWDSTLNFSLFGGSKWKKTRTARKVKLPMGRLM